MVAIDDIMKVIEFEFDLSREDLLMQTRVRSIVEPRQIYHYIASKLNPRMSLNAIAKTTNQTHATVINSIRAVNNLLDTKITFKAELRLITIKCIDYCTAKTIDTENLNVLKSEIINKIKNSNSKTELMMELKDATVLY